MTWWYLLSDVGQCGELDTLLPSLLDAVGRKLIAATNPDEFELALLQTLDDSEAARNLFAASQAVSFLPISNLVGQPLRPDVSEYLGESAERVLLAGRDWLDGACLMLSQCEQELEQSTGEWANIGDDGTLLQLLNRSGLPPAIYELNARAIEGGIASTALISALYRRQRLSDWMATLATARFVSGSRAVVELLGSIPGAEVPASLRLQFTPLDLAKELADYRQAMIGLDLLDAAHRSSGRTISYPFGAGPNEDD